MQPRPGVRRSRRRAAFVLGTLILLVTGAWLFDSLFDEPGAREVASLVDDLGSRSVLAFFAHPDDEVLVCAALADAARRGCVVRTVTATRGEAGFPQKFSGTKQELERLRESELHSLGKRLGIREQVLWEFPDGGLMNVEIEILCDSIRAAVQRYQPDLVVTFDSVAGFTGHPDHRRIGAAVLAVLGPSLRPSPGQGGHTARTWLAQIVCPRRTAILSPPELRARLRRQSRATLAAASSPGIKSLAMDAHASQQQYFPPRWFRPILYSLYDREHFALTPLDP